ncbi:MAG: (d)CMP kinase [Flavobacteriaceae bacterium]|nr:(d)CMP kinase [Flavobacteriaceae bacterium]
MKKIIAIDGHAATGKSTQAKKIAKYLGYKYIDSGAMYRAVTHYCLINGWINKLINLNSILENLKNIDIQFKTLNNFQITTLNGNDVEGYIRKMDVAKNVSKIAAIPEIRSFLVEKQRQIGLKNNVVMDGRDIGTVVFPETENKFFLTASIEVRAERRHEELKLNNESIDFSTVLENVKSRDLDDTSRLTSPLEPAEDAIIVDTSNYSVNEVFDKLISLIKG